MPEMIAAASHGANILADSTSTSSLSLTGPAMQFQPSSAHFYPPATLRLPVWPTFLQELRDEELEFEVGVFTWDGGKCVWVQLPASRPCPTLRSRWKRTAFATKSLR
eukprot:3110357-Rhodomonas_salina.4